MDAMAVTGAVVHMPIFHPLIGMDKEEIVRIARHIGTFDTSILPYEDCCTVFTPRHPKTKPHVEEVREMEEKEKTVVGNSGVRLSGGHSYLFHGLQFPKHL